MKIQLGDRVKCKVTGFIGIAVARTEWLFGCVRFSVTGEKLDKENKEVSYVVDEPQLELIKAQVVKGQVPVAQPTTKERNYGPRNDKMALRRA